MNLCLRPIGKKLGSTLSYLAMALMVGQFVLAGEAHAAQCSSTLGQIFPTPQTSVPPEIKRAFELARSQNVVQTMEKASQQGYSPEAAIAAVMEQARAHDETAARAAKTAEMVDARGVTDEEFMQRFHNGTLEIPAEGCIAVRASALCAMVVNRITAMALRYVAREMRCFEAAGQWPVDTKAAEVDRLVREAVKSGRLTPTSAASSSSTSETTHPFSTSTGWVSGIGAPANVDPCRNCNTTPKSSGTYRGSGGGTGVSRGVQ